MDKRPEWSAICQKGCYFKIGMGQSYPCPSLHYHVSRLIEFRHKFPIKVWRHLWTDPKYFKNYFNVNVIGNIIVTHESLFRNFFFQCAMALKAFKCSNLSICIILNCSERVPKCDNLKFGTLKFISRIIWMAPKCIYCFYANQPCFYSSA